MKNQIVALLALVGLSLGCQANGYTHTNFVPSDPKTEKPPAELAVKDCTSVLHFSLGQSTGTCGQTTGTISVPGAKLVSGIFDALAAAWAGPPPVVNVYSETEPRE